MQIQHRMRYKRLYIGATWGRRPDWRDYVSEPQAPQSYGAEAAARYCEKKREEMEVAAGTRPLTAYINRLVARDDRFEWCLDLTCDDTDCDAVAQQFFEYVSQQRRDDPAKLDDDDYVGLDAFPARWFAFGAKQLFTTLALSALRAVIVNTEDGAEVPASTPMLQQWRQWSLAHEPLWADPYELALPSTVRTTAGLPELFRFLKLPEPQMDDPERQAAAVHDLVAWLDVDSMWQ